MIENKTILVVDDDPKIATLLQTYLEECGFVCTQYRTVSCA